jgi:hypothetical protein
MVCSPSLPPSTNDYLFIGKNRLLTIFSRPCTVAGGKKRGFCRLFTATVVSQCEEIFVQGVADDRRDALAAGAIAKVPCQLDLRATAAGAAIADVERVQAEVRMIV